MDEFNRRCEKVCVELAAIASKYLADKNVIEYNRIIGKIEGVKLAQDYANQVSRLTPLAPDTASAVKAGAAS